jgi:sugar phosphate isomerase/epimerase
MSGIAGLSCADYTWPGLSHPVALDVIADIGFTGVDLGFFGDATHVTIPALLADPVGYSAAIRERVAAAGLVVADLFLTPDAYDLAVLDPANPDSSDQRESRRIFDATVQFAVELGAPGVTLLPGVRHPGQSNRDAIAAAARTLAPRVDVATAAGLRLSFEPHIGSIADNPERALDLVERTPGLQITLDPSHLVFAGATVDELVALLPHTGHVQLRPGGVGRMQTRVPENEIDFTRLLDGLLRAGYRGWVAAEYVWMAKWGCDAVDNTAETIRLKRQLDAWLAGDPT